MPLPIMLVLKLGLASVAGAAARWCRPPMSLLAVSVLFALTSTAVRAGEALLEPERAFALSARALDESTIELVFTAAPGYYLYRDAFRFTADAAVLGPVEIPRGRVKFDETFGKNVETHRGDVRVRLAVLQGAATFRLIAVSQGCADVGLCYPPLTRTADVSLAAYGGSGHVRFVLANGIASPASMLASAAAATSGQDADTTLGESGTADARKVLRTSRLLR